VESKGLTESRKLDHIKAVLERRVESDEETLLDDVRIIHNSLPEVNLDEVSLEKDFCGKTLKAPLMITGMTGGHPETAEINRNLAVLAHEYGIALGVGSQRAGIEDPRLAETFSIARRAAPDVFLVANIGAPQLAGGYTLREIKKAIEMIDADAIAIHLNPAQEAYQIEGEPYYAGIISRLAEIIDSIDIPVIIKETGNGLSGELVRELYGLGFKCFDVSGLGGTNWVKVEVVRAAMRGQKPLPAGRLADYWGNPTAIAVIEARNAAPHSYIIGSGGIRDGFDAARAIALGADIAGVALPVLRSLLLGGLEKAREYLESVLYQLKTILYLTGGRRVTDLWRAPLVIHGRLLEEISVRGINTHEYLRRTRLEPLRVQRWRNTQT